MQGAHHIVYDNGLTPYEEDHAQRRRGQPKLPHLGDDRQRLMQVFPAEHHIHRDPENQEQEQNLPY